MITPPLGNEPQKVIPSNEKMPVFMEYGMQPSSEQGAIEWFEETVCQAKNLNSSTQELRRSLFFLVFYDIHMLIRSSRTYMFKDIVKKSGLNPSTIYDYVNAAMVEKELNLTQGVMSIDALVYLKEHASKEDWKVIFDNGIELKRAHQEIEKSNKKRSRSSRNRKALNEYLTKKQVQDSIASLKKHNKQSQVDNASKVEVDGNSNSLKSNKKHNSKLEGWDNNPLQSYDDDVVYYYDDDDDEIHKKQLKIAKTQKLKKQALGMAIEKKEKMLKVFLDPSSTYPERLAFRLSRRLDSETLNKLIEELKIDIENSH